MQLENNINVMHVNGSRCTQCLFHHAGSEPADEDSGDEESDKGNPSPTAILPMIEEQDDDYDDSHDDLPTRAASIPTYTDQGQHGKGTDTRKRSLPTQNELTAPKRARMTGNCFFEAVATALNRRFIDSADHLCVRRAVVIGLGRPVVLQMVLRTGMPVLTKGKNQSPQHMDRG